MRVEIILFGQLAEIAGSNIIVIDEITTTNELEEKVNTLYPAMRSIKYIIAVDKKTIHANTSVNERTSVALLPPFSGG